MEFEWHERKRLANLIKHRIDFERARTAWDGIMLDPHSENHHHGEHRRTALGSIIDDEGEKIIAITYTKREDRIRIISVRAARRDERADYEAQVERSRRG